MAKPLKLAVLLSGNGTNFQAILDAIDAKQLNAKVELVLSNKKEVHGLTRAKNYGIKHHWINRKNFENTDQYFDAYIQLLQETEVDLVVLAGFLLVLPPRFIKAFSYKIINIHPSLIPSFCGKGFYGEKVHQAVYNSGVKLTGATVHFVDEGTDTGPIIRQEATAISTEDTVVSIAQKVLKVEHKLLVESLKLIADGKTKLIKQGEQYKVAILT